MFWRRRVRLNPALYERAVAEARKRGLPSVEAYVAELLERDLKAAAEQELRDRVLDKMKGLGYLQ